jgi:hypothetical protein
MLSPKRTIAELKELCAFTGDENGAVRNGSCKARMAGIDFYQ